MNRTERQAINGSSAPKDGKEAFTKQLETSSRLTARKKSRGDVAGRLHRPGRTSCWSAKGTNSQKKPVTLGFPKWRQTGAPIYLDGMLHFGRRSGSGTVSLADRAGRMGLDGNQADYFRPIQTEPV